MHLISGDGPDSVPATPSTSELMKKSAPDATSRGRSGVYVTYGFDIDGGTMAATTGGEEFVREDEQLEILFGWIGGDSQHGIEAGLDEYLDHRPLAARRRRLPWPGRRDAHPA